MNALFRNTLNERTIRLRKLAQKLGKCVSECRPYYECRTRVTELQKRCQMAVQTFERSAELHSQSKETITIAETKFADNKNNESDFDHFWQEMLNQANTKGCPNSTRCLPSLHTTLHWSKLSLWCNSSWKRRTWRMRANTSTAFVYKTILTNKNVSHFWRNSWKVL